MARHLAVRRRLGDRLEDREAAVEWSAQMMVCQSLPRALKACFRRGLESVLALASPKPTACFGRFPACSRVRFCGVSGG